MSDELDKLAAEMKNLRPSSSARHQGMNAAMAAFDAEFAAQSKTTSENNSVADQGMADAARPTGKPTGKPTGNALMSKLSNLFAFKPRTMMMAGSCMAALMAAMVFIPATTPMLSDNTELETFSDVAVEVAPEQTFDEVIAAERQVETDAGKAADLGSDEIVVTGARREAKKEDDVSAPAQPEPAPPSLQAEAPVAPIQETEQSKDVASVETEPSESSNATSISELLDEVRTDSEETDIKNKKAEFRQRRDQQASRLAVTPSSNGASSEQRKRRDLGSSVPEAEGVVRFEIRDGNDQVVPEPRSRDQFERAEPNPVTSVIEKPVSTFSIDVDTASYSFFRAAVNRGQLPPAGSVRVEEMINYFPYDYAAPRSASQPFKANVTVTPTPWNADTKLMHIGIKGYVPPMDEKPRSNIVLLIDTSGSMNQPNKLPLLINSFKLLLGTLDADDTVSIVTYAGSAGTALEPTSASNKDKINAALNDLRAGGSTAGAAGLELAYQKAAENFDDEGINRVILATDGDFNVGYSSNEDMKRIIAEKRKTGIFLSVLGFGMGNYNDALMQSLAQNGNGVAAYIDSLAEANKVLADEAGSALIPIAKDVKIQVEFNPATIAEYRLIGYETRALKRQDFNNDAVDAGDINSGHSVTAIYELTPVGSPAQAIDDLRYAAESGQSDSAASDEFAFIKIRHKLPNADISTLQTFPIGPEQERVLGRSSDDMRFAAAVAAVGQKLRGDSQLAGFSYQDAIALASDAKGEDENGYRAEFIQLVRLVDSLQP